MITTPTQVNTGTRIASMVLDHFMMSIIAMIFFIPQIIIIIAAAGFPNRDTIEPDFLGPALFLCFAGYAIYFCKDCINGRSIAKRIIKLQVVDNDTGEAASPLQCMVRNLFCIIWPIEVIMTLVNPERRLGDLVAGTRVAVFDPAVSQPQPNVVKIIIALILAYAVIAIPFYALFTAFLPSQ